MQPTAFDEENFILDPPKGMTQDQCESISVFMGYTQQRLPIVVSCWKITKEELEKIISTGRVWLVIAGEGMPPVHLTADNPFTTPTPPSDDSHGTQT